MNFRKWNRAVNKEPNTAALLVLRGWHDNGIVTDFLCFSAQEFLRSNRLLVDAMLLVAHADLISSLKDFTATRSPEVRGGKRPLWLQCGQCPYLLA